MAYKTWEPEIKYLEINRLLGLTKPLNQTLQFTQDLRQGRPADETGFDPRTQAPFLGILVEEIG